MALLKRTSFAPEPTVLPVKKQYSKETFQLPEYDCKYHEEYDDES
jgi:hypothetical protein